MDNLLVSDSPRMEAQDMRLSDVERASQLIQEVLQDEGEDNLVYLSAMVPPAHKDLISGLAKINKAKQAAVLRAIIDEWCEFKLQASLTSEAQG
ncbi:MAG: hypothetical protein H6658_02275 [Ardenticatenaceae bacterium]|nr:hypothetical protein [Ardenticatenaceae bacterium]